MQVENIENQEQQAQQDEAAFEAGFNKTRGDEPTVEIPSQTTADESAAEASTEVQSVEQPQADAQVVEEPVIAGFKESELKALLAKAQEIDGIKASITGNNDKVFGKFGEMQRFINELKANPAQPGQQVKVTGDKLKRLRQEFPEMADMLAEDLGELLTSPAQGTFDPAEIKQEFTRQLEETNRSYEQKLLTMKHPDWSATVKSDDFKLWKGTLPVNVREQLENSWDAAFISEALTAFGAHKATSAASTKQSKAKRLEAASTPSGVPNTGPAITPDNEGLNAGFKKVRGKP